MQKRFVWVVVLGVFMGCGHGGAIVREQAVVFSPIPQVSETQEVHRLQSSAKAEFEQSQERERQAAERAQEASRSARATSPTPVTARPVQSRTGAHRGYATARECISMVENGGQYDRSSNPNHFGRYQFDMNAWVDYGGDPEDWGTASPEEQDRVFDNAMAAGAYSRWLPYDGC